MGYFLLGLMVSVALDLVALAILARSPRLQAMCRAYAKKKFGVEIRVLEKWEQNMVEEDENGECPDESCWCHLDKNA